MYCIICSNQISYGHICNWSILVCRQYFLLDMILHIIIDIFTWAHQSSRSEKMVNRAANVTHCPIFFPHFYPGIHDLLIIIIAYLFIPIEMLQFIKLLILLPMQAAL